MYQFINEKFQGWWVGQVRHSFTTRLLYSLIPSTWYAKNDASVDGLLKDLSTDMTDIFQHGITIQVFWHQQLTTCRVFRSWLGLNLLFVTAPRLVIPRRPSIWFLPVPKVIGLGFGKVTIWKLVFEVSEFAISAHQLTFGLNWYQW